MAFEPAQRVSAYQAVVDQIESAIERGELQVGDRLPGERQLMADFSVSRATIREALRVLQAGGLVESRAGDPRGPIITRYSPQLLGKSMLRMAQVDSVSRVELLQFRLLLEGQAALLAAVRRSDDDVAAILSRCDDLDALARSGADGFGSTVNAFHSAIRRASRNQLIEACGDAMASITLQVTERRLAVDRDARARLARSAANARTLADVIAAGDSRAAYTTAVGNIYRFYEEDLDESERRSIRPLVELGGDGS